MLKRKKVYSVVLASIISASMVGSIFASEVDLLGDGTTPIDHTVDVTGKIGPWQGDPGNSDKDPDFPEIDPPDVAQISVSVPVTMGFQVASNAINNTTVVPEFLTAEYKVINHSKSTSVNVHLEEFLAKQGNGFEVINTQPTKGNGKVEMNLGFLYGSSKRVDLDDNYNTSELLGVLAPSQEEILTFDSQKFEIPNDEGQSKVLQSKYDLKLKVSVNP